MHDADVEENEPLIDNNTIKRAPKSKKREKRDSSYENPIDTNNNTLKRTNGYEIISQTAKENDIFSIKQTHSQLSKSFSGIPSVPSVRMGACFIKIFNQ